MESNHFLPISRNFSTKLTKKPPKIYPKIPRQISKKFPFLFTQFLCKNQQKRPSYYH
jgi:hypothetical protein